MNPSLSFCLAYLLLFKSGMAKFLQAEAVLELVEKSLTFYKEGNFCDIFLWNISTMDSAYLKRNSSLTFVSLDDLTVLGDPSRQRKCSFLVTHDQQQGLNELISKYGFFVKYFIVMGKIDLFGERKFYPRAVNIFTRDDGIIVIKSKCETFPEPQVWFPGSFEIKPNQDPFGHCSRIDQQVKGKELTASIFGLVPYVTPLCQAGGLDCKIADILAQKLGFRINYKAARGWGTRLPDGSWIGIVGDLQKGEAEFGFGDFGITNDRLEAIDYTHFIYTMKIGVMTRKPVPVQPFFKIIQPLDQWSWLFYFISALAIALSSKITMMALNLDHRGVFRVLLDTIVMLFSAYEFKKHTWMGAVKGSGSGWIILLAWTLGTATFTFFYVSTLRSVLVSVQYTKELNSIKDIMDINSPVYLTAGSSIVESLKTSDQTSIRKAYDVAKQGNFYVRGLPNDSIVEHILTKAAGVMIVELSAQDYASRYLKRNGQQPFHYMDEYVFMINAGFGVSKLIRDLKYEFNKILKWLVDYGIVMRLFDEYNPPNEKLLTRATSELLTPWHFISIFIFYAASSLLAIMVFVLEVHRYI